MYQQMKNIQVYKQLKKIKKITKFKTLYQLQLHLW